MTQAKADITVTTPDPGSQTSPTRRRRWPIVLLVLVVAGAAGVAFIASSGGDDASTATVAANRTFREVVTTDLIAVETLEGVVGFDAGDPILAGAAGRLTAAIEPGIVATEGDILFEIDAEPIPLLFSDEIFKLTVTNTFIYLIIQVPIMLGLALVLLTGAADELHQSTLPHRDADVMDWLADAAGALAAFGAARLLKKE